MAPQEWQQDYRKHRQKLHVWASDGCRVGMENRSEEGCAKKPWDLQPHKLIYIEITNASIFHKCHFYKWDSLAEQTLTWSSWFQSLGWPPLAPLKLLWDRLEQEWQYCLQWALNTCTDSLSISPSILYHLHTCPIHKYTKRSKAITGYYKWILILFNGATEIEGYVASDEP